VTTHNFEQLKAHILPLSQAQAFSDACREWVLEAVEVSDDWDHCPCGQEIKEHCYLRNTVTGSRTYVGNVCVNRFLGIDTGTLFDGLRRIRDNPKANANLAVVEYAESRGFLYEKEPTFLRSTMRKRILSQRQADWKEKINRRILEGIVVRKRTVRPTTD
jgi:hypothetical protein